MNLHRASLVLFILALEVAGALAWAQDAPHAEHQPPPEAAPTPPVPRPELPAFIPAITDEDRKAAFPEVTGHAAHDKAIGYFVLLDQLEWQSGASDAVSLDTRGWIGRDRDRLWFRVEGEGESDAVWQAQTHLFYGRQVSRWWDVVGGLRQDSGPDADRTWLALGMQGLAPYWFDIEATGYVSTTAVRARFEVEYELLLTNRLIVQPLFELELIAPTDAEDPESNSGLDAVNVGLRLRYEFRRECAPYVGITWKRTGHASTTDDSAGEDSGVGLVTGLRLWF